MSQFFPRSLFSLFSLGRRSRDLGEENRPLDRAANAVKALAKEEHLALSYIAERDCPNRPEFWFAGNILKIVTVHGRLLPSGHVEQLPKTAIEQLELRDDMTSLGKPGETWPHYVDLMVMPGEFKKYLRWLRSVH